MCDFMVGKITAAERVTGCGGDVRVTTLWAVALLWYPSPLPWQQTHGLWAASWPGPDARQGAWPAALLASALARSWPCAAPPSARWQVPVRIHRARAGLCQGALPAVLWQKSV
jgi:hypothetical protein